jgi:plasmid stabilization system protein ParE
VTYRVLFTPEAEDHLDQLYLYIAEAADHTVAARYVDAVIDYCEGLAVFQYVAGPETTSARDCARSVTRSARSVAFAIRNDTVVVLGIFHGGRDYEAILSEPDDDAL